MPSPDPDEIDEHLDLFGNRVVRLGVHHPHDRLGVISRCIVDVDDVVGEAPCWRSTDHVGGRSAAVRSLRGALAVEVGAARGGHGGDAADPGDRGDGGRAVPSRTSARST